MARSRDMRNLIQRGDTWHFRGYVPKDLIGIVGKREVHRSLGTTVHAEAVRLRDAERIRHRDAMDEARRRHEREFLTIYDLDDEEVLDIAREVYAQQLAIAKNRRGEFAASARENGSFEMGGYNALHDELRRGVVIGGDKFGAARVLTNQILEDRMIDLSGAPKARERLQQRISEVIAQVQHDLLDMIEGYPAQHADPSLLDPETRLPRRPSFQVDGRPGSTGPVKNTLANLSEEFLKEVRLRRRDKGYSAMVASMRLLVEFFGPDMDARRIRRRECAQFREFVMSLPTNYRKRYPRLSVTEIPANPRPEHELMSYANVNKILRHLIQFLGWCEEMEVIERAPSNKNLTLREPVSEKEKRQPFTEDQLQQIFSSSFMRQEACNRSMFFWCYVIGLYQGLRLNEIAAMSADSIVVVDGTHCMDVRIPDGVLDRDTPGGTKTIPRSLPMHWVLVELGLPEFASDRPPGAKLFAEARAGADGYLSRDVSDKTRTFLDILGMPTGGPTFHSLRHCFRDAMTEADLSQDVSAFLGGWKLSGTMNAVCGSSKLRKSYKDHLDRVSYGDIDNIVVSLKDKLAGSIN